MLIETAGHLPCGRPSRRQQRHPCFTRPQRHGNMSPFHSGLFNILSGVAADYSLGIDFGISSLEPVPTLHHRGLLIRVMLDKGTAILCTF